MADVNFDDVDGGRRVSAGPGHLQPVINLVGAACSVALIAGLAVWGYNLAVRDVSGVPVVRALEGPMRVAPDTPGGVEAAHQGLAVNDVAAVGVASPPPERLVLAPRPVELSLDDTPGLASTVPELVTADPLALPEPVPEATPIDPVIADLPATEEEAVALALAAALADDAAPETAAPIDAAGGLARSPRPLARPARGADAGAVTAVQNVSAPADVAEIDPATLEIGTRLVQLGAFDTADLARAEYAKLMGRFGDLMTGKSAVIQSAQSGGRAFFRLRAHGFADEDDARRFCSALLSEDAACIPVAHR